MKSSYLTNFVLFTTLLPTFPSTTLFQTSSPYLPIPHPDTTTSRKKHNLQILVEKLKTDVADLSAKLVKDETTATVRLNDEAPKTHL